MEHREFQDEDSDADAADEDYYNTMQEEASFGGQNLQNLNLAPSVSTHSQHQRIDIDCTNILSQNDNNTTMIDQNIQCRQQQQQTTREHYNDGNKGLLYRIERALSIFQHSHRRQRRMSTESLDSTWQQHQQQQELGNDNWPPGRRRASMSDHSTSINTIWRSTSTPSSPRSDNSDTPRNSSSSRRSSRSSLNYLDWSSSTSQFIDSLCHYSLIDFQRPEETEDDMEGCPTGRGLGEESNPALENFLEKKMGGTHRDKNDTLYSDEIEHRVEDYQRHPFFGTFYHADLESEFLPYYYGKRIEKVVSHVAISLLSDVFVFVFFYSLIPASLVTLLILVALSLVMWLVRLIKNPPRDIDSFRSMELIQCVIEGYRTILACWISVVRMQHYFVNTITTTTTTIMMMMMMNLMISIDTIRNSILSLTSEMAQ